MLTSLQALLRLATLRWLGVFVCALATLLATTSSASALEPAQTKTRVWGFDFAADNSVGLFRAASSGKHQRNRLARAEAASGSLLAARGAVGRTVLGHAGYVEKAQKLGANYFQIADDVWMKMSDAERWAANQKFLDDVIARGDEVILSTPAGKAFPNSFFDRELRYLAGKGYSPSVDGTRMLPKL